MLEKLVRKSLSVTLLSEAPSELSRELNLLCKSDTLLLDELLVDVALAVEVDELLSVSPSLSLSLLLLDNCDSRLCRSNFIGLPELA